MTKAYLLLIAILVTSCGYQNDQKEGKTSEVTPKEEPYTLARPKSDWVTKRVNEAKERLQGTEAGALVWKAMEFHGGLSKWWNNGPIYFRFNYQPKPGTGTPRDTYETADYWSSKTRHQRASNQTEEYGWDGQNAWFYPDTAKIPYNTRFWALTPYYFAGMPFVFADEGVNLAKEADAEYEGNTYHIVRATFGDGVGDAPDDFYVLYINPETYRLAAIRYIVSYPAYFQKGQHSQEKFMTYEGQQNVGGITFPEKHRTYLWEANGSIGKYVTDISLTDISFKPETQQSYFNMPAGSFVMDGLK